ncbi:MAG: hypothetical protein ACRCTR_03930 [Actinomycetota bacterium]
MTARTGEDHRLSVVDVYQDDQLLDHIGQRKKASAPRHDPMVAALTAWVRDVDTDLPHGLDVVERAALQGLKQGALTTHRVIGRGGAVVASLVVLLGSAGVAAAVSGDAAGAFGVRALTGLVSGEPQPSAQATADWLRQRVELAARRPGGPDPQEISELRSAAAELPDESAAKLRQQLAQIPVAVATATQQKARQTQAQTQTPKTTTDPSESAVSGSLSTASTTLPKILSPDDAVGIPLGGVTVPFSLASSAASEFAGTSSATVTPSVGPSSSASMSVHVLTRPADSRSSTAPTSAPFATASSGLDEKAR